MNLKKKLISVASAAALAVTGLTGLGVSAADTTLITNGGPYTGNASYIGTYFKSDYFGNNAFEISYKYTKLATNEEVEETVDGVTSKRPIDYTDTFEFLVFDQNWGGWDKTTVGQANPVVGTEYKTTVSIADIESKLSTTGSSVQGINLQTGGINDATVEITSLKYVAGTVASQEVEIKGSWVKGKGGTMTVDGTGASVSTNEWNIQVSQFSVSQFANPRVDVTVKYDTAPNNYVQAELQKMSGTPVVANYPYVSSKGEVTYTTEIPSNLTAFLACFDACTVTKIHIYDYKEGNVAKSKSGQTATAVAADMGMAWNLGNSFDAVDSDGNVSETIWGNAITRKELFIAVKEAGFNTIRIPVSYMNMINADNTVNEDYLERLQVVINDAYNMNMYVVINVHNDGGHGIVNKWLDITKTGDEFEAIKNKFAGVWTSIATYFKDYDQKLVFEGFNELLVDYSTVPTATEYEKINALNQAFVNAVRNTGSANEDRVLIVAGYNTNIDYTIAGFEAPEDSSEYRLMLSVHFYDPIDFAITEYGTSSWNYADNGAEMESTIDSICTFAAGENMPVFIGEYGPIDKTNTTARAEYCYYLNKHAASKTNAKVVLAYWDNGVIDPANKGSGLFDRTTNTITATGTTLVSYIKAGHNNSGIPS